jgi:hypothetical protein
MSLEFEKGQELANAAAIEFEADSIIGLDREKLTFVCELCISVNSIDSHRCSKCGKPRPRGEYVSALKMIRLSQKVKKDPLLFQEVLVGQIESRNKVAEAEAKRIALEEEARLAYEAAVDEAAKANEQKGNAVLEKLYKEEVEAMQPQPAPGYFGAYYGVPSQRVVNIQTESGKTKTLIQPFAVMPYINQGQPLWQYDSQIYRFVPDSYQQGAGYGEFIDPQYNDEQAYDPAYDQYAYGQQAYEEQPYYADQPYEQPAQGEQVYDEQAYYAEQAAYEQAAYEEAAYEEAMYAEEQFYAEQQFAEEQFYAEQAAYEEAFYGLQPEYNSEYNPMPDFFPEYDTRV